MYIEHMLTPNPMRYPDANYDRFVNATEAVLGDYNQGEGPNNETTLLVADGIQKVVRDSLHYPEKADHWLSGYGSDGLQTMVDDAQTNCIGYTMAGSEAMSRAGIKHYVVYGQEHFFLFVPATVDGKARIYNRDMLLPEFNGDVTDSLRFGTPETISQALEADPHRQHNIALNTAIFATWLQCTTRELASSYKQLWGRRDANTDIHNTYYELDGLDPGKQLNRRRFNERFNWIVSVYQPEAGRDVMTHYSGLMHAVAIGNVTLGLEHMRALAGKYPENNGRAKHVTIRRFIGQICMSEAHQAATDEIIDAYCSSIRTGDPRVLSLRADLNRQKADMTGDPTAAAQAIKAYQAASDASRITGFKRALTGKSLKVTNKLATISTTSDVSGV